MVEHHWEQMEQQSDEELLGEDYLIASRSAEIKRRVDRQK
jgi:hypothetical protein